jgi:hypothetical protein
MAMNPIRGAAAVAATAILCALMDPYTAEAQVGWYYADLNRDQVVPPTPSPGHATLRIEWCISQPNDSVDVEVSYSDLLGAPIRCDLFLGIEGMNGTHLYTVCDAWFPPESATTIIFAAADCDYLHGSSIYAVIGTDLYPEGEIRGQIINPGYPVEPATWGRIKSTYR